MKRYSEYKDSGVKWIGLVPEHWSICRLKYLSTCNDEALAETYPDESIINYVEIGDVTLSEGIKNSTVYQFGKAPSRARRITRENDVIISTVRTYLQAIATVNQPNLVVSTGFAVIRPTGNQNAEYLSFALKSKNTIDWIVSESTGISYPAITANKLNSAPICTPPLCEQQAIVSYLDDKVAKIDRYIAVAEQKIKALEELKQTIISDAVTHGINPHVKMKDSGIKWVGMVPEHWTQLRAKHMFVRQIRPVREQDEVITCFRDGQVTLRRNRRIEGFTESLKEIGYQGIRKGDLVIHQMDAFAGSIGVSDSDGKGTPVYICCLPNGPYDVYYYAFLLREMARSGFIKSLYRGIRERSSDFRFDTFANQWMPTPPLSEQQAIVSYLDRKVSQIEQLRTKELSQIEKLKEYKQRLICDAVTGKVKVIND